MSWIDYLIFALYMAGVLAVGAYFFKRNESATDYFVGNRDISAGHVGLSIVATDVGGGFSIGLGGLGFAMGLAGSWMLLTGLIGAWLSAVFIIPRIKAVDSAHGMLTYPDFLRFRYGSAVAWLAALISAAGYIGFSAGQVLAGAKLAAGTLFPHAPWGIPPVTFAIVVIGVVMIGYTVLGGLKAVIYTDTMQWIILLLGLSLFAVPFALHEIGGFAELYRRVGPAHFDLGNVSAGQLVRWAVTIIPIWIVAMTLYQRMFACRDVKQARRAWYIAGLFEYPIMAFLGVFLGLCGRALFPELSMADKEMALPMLIGQVLPVGIAGIVAAGYFSAIMSTADSCLLAASGNVVSDLLGRTVLKGRSDASLVRWSQIITLLAGLLSMLLATRFTDVLDSILHAYEFLVSGLFVPTLGAYFWRRSSSVGALAAMVVGGSLTLILLAAQVPLPATLPAVAVGILASALVFVPLSLLFPPSSEAQQGFEEMDV